jgi:hypothetical protein
LYFRVSLRYCDVEELLGARGIHVTWENPLPVAGC